MTYDTKTTVSITMTNIEAVTLKNLLEVVNSNLQGMLLASEKEVLKDFKDTLQEAVQ